MGVKVICYGKEEQWNSREEAIAYYQRAILGCDPQSSECGRYVSIMCGLVSGLSVASDE